MWWGVIVPTRNFIFHSNACSLIWRKKDFLIFFYFFFRLSPHQFFRPSGAPVNSELCVMQKRHPMRNSAIKCILIYLSTVVIHSPEARVSNCWRRAHYYNQQITEQKIFTTIINTDSFTSLCFFPSKHVVIPNTNCLNGPQAGILMHF